MRILSAFILIASVYFLTACQPNNGSSGGQGSAAPSPVIIKAETPESDGASSGGGGFLKINAEPLLDEARIELSARIGNASLKIFKNFPEGWNREKLANVILNVRKNFGHESRRDRDIMLDYGKDEKGEYIEVLRPFGYVYGGVPKRSYGADREIVIDVQRKLLHEVAHFWVGGDDEKAETIANRILEALNRDVIECGETSGRDKGYEFYLNRSTLINPRYSFNDFEPGNAQQQLEKESEAGENDEWLRRIAGDPGDFSNLLEEENVYAAIIAFASDDKIVIEPRKCELAQVGRLCDRLKIEVFISSDNSVHAHVSGLSERSTEVLKTSADGKSSWRGPEFKQVHVDEELTDCKSYASAIDFN